MTDAREQLAKALDSSGDAGADWSEVQADAIDEFVEERDDAVKVAIAVLIHNRNVQRGKTVDAITQRLEAVERAIQMLREATGFTEQAKPFPYEDQAKAFDREMGEVDSQFRAELRAIAAKQNQRLRERKT